MLSTDIEAANALIAFVSIFGSIGVIVGITAVVQRIVTGHWN